MVFLWYPDVQSVRAVGKHHRRGSTKVLPGRKQEQERSSRRLSQGLTNTEKSCGYGTSQRLDQGLANTNQKQNGHHEDSAKALPARKHTSEGHKPAGRG